MSETCLEIRIKQVVKKEKEVSQLPGPSKESSAESGHSRGGAFCDSYGPLLFEPRVVFETRNLISKPLQARPPREAIATMPHLRSLTRLQHTTRHRGSSLFREAKQKVGKSA